MPKRDRTAVPATVDFSSLLSQHKKVKRQRKQPRSKQKDAEIVTPILAALRRINKSGELLTTNPTNTNATPRNQQTLALCFLCVEKLPHRKLWQEWVRQAEHTAKKGGHGLKIFIHAKFPERLDPWSQQYLIRDDRGEVINFKPEWGKIEVTRALMKLFEIALTHPDVGRMTYVSESCIPICTFDHACSELWRSDRSWVAAYDKPVNGYDTLMMNAVNTKYIPKECVRKCDTWCMLTRKHAHAILIDIPTIAGSEIWPHFSRVKVADEIFMPTMMTVIGAIRGGGIPGGTGKRNELTSQHKDEVERRKTTHVDWSKGGPHPKAFESFDLQVQKDGFSNGCIFARKFAEGTVTLDIWRQVCNVTPPIEEENDGNETSLSTSSSSSSSSTSSTSTSSSSTSSSSTSSSSTSSSTSTSLARSLSQKESIIVPYTGKRDVLVIVCAGDTSLHDEERWYTEDRTYDLCVVYYGGDANVAKKYERDSDHYHKQQGPKWQLIRSILQKGIHSNYEYVWMPVSLFFLFNIRF